VFPIPNGFHPVFSFGDRASVRAVVCFSLYHLLPAIGRLSRCCNCASMADNGKRLSVYRRQATASPLPLTLPAIGCKMLSVVGKRK